MAGGINKNKHLEAATKHVSRGQLDRAIKELQKILEHDPNDIPVRLKVAGLLARLQRAEEALAMYEHVADRFVREGFNARAVAVYELMVKIEPQRMDLHIKLGDLYAQLLRRADALREYQIVAAWFDAKGRAVESLEVLRKMAEIGPDNARVRRKLAELMLQAGQREEARAELSRLAETLRQKPHAPELPDVLDRLAALSPEDPAALREAARAHLARRDPRRALARLQGAFTLDPRDPATLSLLAESFLALGNRPKALAVTRELARVHDAAGRAGERDEAWREVLRLDPGDAEAKDALDAPIPLTEISRADDEPLVYQGGKPRAPAPRAPDATAPMTVARLLNEADIYLRYGIKAKAFEHIEMALQKDPRCLDEQPRLASFHRRVLDGEVSVPPTAVRPAGRGASGAGARMPPRAAKPAFVEVSVEVSEALAELAPGADFREALDEAEFFVRQELYEEAISIYRELAQRFPREEGIRAKLRTAEDALARTEAAPRTARAPADDRLELDLDGGAQIELDAASPQVSVAEVLQDLSGELELATGKRDDFELGVTYRDMGLPDEAIAAFEKAAAQPARSAESLQQIGLVKLERGDAEGALKVLEKAATLASAAQAPAIQFSLGNALEAAGRFEEAAALYRRLLEAKNGPR